MGAMDLKEVLDIGISRVDTDFYSILRVHGREKENEIVGTDGLNYKCESVTDITYGSIVPGP